MKSLAAPLKWHGGKAYMAKHIINLMPPRCTNPNAPAPNDPGWLHFVEPYFGGGQVMLALDPEGISEVANDLNEHLTNFWQVLQSVGKFDRFRKLCEATPFSEVEYQKASAQLHDLSDDPEMAAWIFFIRCRQSLAGRMQGFTGIARTRTRRGMNDGVSGWLSAVEGLPEVHARLKRVLILNRPALEVIKKHDGPRTLFYLDPPYLHETRATTGEYHHEMTEDQHKELLECLATIKGRFLLSGYRSYMYDYHSDCFNWKRHDFQIDNKASGAKEKRKMTECVWCNY